MVKLIDLLKEIIDIYSPEELNDKEIEYNIEENTPRYFSSTLKYKDQYYALRILPVFNPKIPHINFGNTDETYNQLNLSQLLNSPYSSRVLAAIFGLIRYWVDSNNIKEFGYVAEGDTRNKIYDYYLNKHFSDFEKTSLSEPNDDMKDIIWTKK